MQTLDKEEWIRYRNEYHRMAKQRPMMFFGSEQYGHRVAIIQSLALVWIAKIFRSPQQADVFLSPHQFVVRCKTNPLVKELHRVLSWDGKQVLTDNWGTELDKYTGFDKRITIGFRGWKYYHCCRTGPRISNLGTLDMFSHRFCLAIKTDAGFWCQTFADGIPESEPFLLKEKSSTGLILAVSLDSQWCEIPLTQEDAEAIKSFHHNTTIFRRVKPGSGCGGSGYTMVLKKRDIEFPRTNIHWCEEDNLVSLTSSPADEIRKWL
jgi:hypothetical protein